MKKIFRLFSILILLIPVLLFPQGSLLMMGGGSDAYYPGSWVAPVYIWFVQQADSGKIINIDVSSVAQGYADDFISCGADPASHSLQIATRTAANDSAIFKELISAKGIFIEGGDQWDYVKTWKNTLVEDAIHYVFENGGVIGGTSAGLAIEGSVSFSAQYGSLYPEDAAYNPYSTDMQFEDDFLQILPGVITDSHFHPRGRLGRLVPMLARRIQDYHEDLVGIGIDEKTALCLKPDRTGKVYGIGSVTIIHKTDKSVIHCTPYEPVVFTNLCLHQLIDEMEYDLTNRQVLHPENVLKAVFQVQPEFRYQTLTINGSDESAAYDGAVVITKLTGSATNAWYGRLEQSVGNENIPQSIIIPRLYSNSDYFENRWIGGMYGAADHPGYIAIYLDDDCHVRISSDGILTTDKLVYILDTGTMTHAGFKYPQNSNHPGMVNTRLHFLNSFESFQLSTRQVNTGIAFENPDIPDDYLLISCFPNPFNAILTVHYQIPVTAHTEISIFSLDGKYTKSIINSVQNRGKHTIHWNFNSNYGSGLYFIRLRNSSYTKTIKVLYLK
ncbi:MAG: T9SS type A sorting domain-containing protein [Fidelibacterota bacterium]